MSILITGASGFLGTHFLSELRRSTDQPLVGTYVRSGGADASGITWLKANLTNPDEAVSLIQFVRPTHLLLSAWIATPRIFWSAPANSDWAIGSIRLLYEAAKIGTRVVGVGTCAEYDWSKPVTTEASAIAPATLYGRKKAEVAAIAEELGMAWGRIFMPYGRGESSERLLQSVANAVRIGTSVDLTSGQQIRDFTCAKDIAKAFVRLLLSDATGTFNIGTGKGTSIRSAVEMLVDAIGADRRLLRFGARPDRDEPLRLVPDVSRLKQVIAYVPDTELAAGLRDAYVHTNSLSVHSGDRR